MALANYQAVFNRTNAGGPATQNDERKFLKGKLLATTGIEIARVVKLEAESVKEAQEILAAAYPDLNTSTPVIVTEAAWKES